MVVDLSPGPQSSALLDLVAAGGVLFFRFNNHPVHGDELWRSDGTAAGTFLARDIHPGLAGAGILSVRAAGSGTRVIFSATDPASGSQVWVSDGTTSGTVQIAAIAPPGESSFAREFTRVGTRVFFAAQDGITGSELHAVPLALTGGTLVEAYGRGCAGTGSRTPTLGAAGLPTVGNQAFAARLENGLGNTAVVLFLGLNQWSVPLGGGCLSLVAAPYLLVAVAATDGGGSATVPLPLPSDPSLRGGEVFLQALVIDPAGALGGQASLSPGLRLMLGF
jgi:ELWxxDGT repeat protein